ncbi:MAG TPA: tripartite tricarboxylate transporter substrate-binding protein [Xanthobacteraceae bacterium]|nr:tripartite tricarboxylate transporter substrate-binding protein [Xanthobacteraceae bacterium]
MAIGLTVALTSAQFGDAAVQDSDFPKHAIKLIVGPSPDVFSRIVAEHLQEAWGQPVIVEPRPGAGGKIAVNAVLAAPPDGYTMLFTTPTYTLNTAMKVATYDLLKEFDAVAIVGLISYALVAHPSVPAKSVPELINYAKRNPGKLNCASAGIGTVPHLACEYLNKIAGVSLVHVPFRDVNSAMMATVGNTTQIFFGVATNAKAQIDAGALRGLAVSTERRSLLLPDLPTMIEVGYPTFNMPGWGGFITPAGAPARAVAKLNGEIRRAVDRPELRARLVAAGMEPPPPYGPAEVREFLADDIARWTRFVDAVGVDKLTQDGQPQ